MENVNGSGSSLEILSNELQAVLRKPVKITQIFGEYQSLSIDGLSLVKACDEKLFFNLACECGDGQCPVGGISQESLQNYEQLETSASGKGYFDLGEPDLTSQKRLCIDILACQSRKKDLSIEQDLVKKGSIPRKLAIRLGRIGINTVDDLVARGVEVAYHDLKDVYPQDTVETHLFALSARVENKNVMFLSQDEKNAVKSKANSELAKRVREKIEASRKITQP
ncbi:TfoX/Sxy family DNA transformation protein [Vibrio mediterranei]|uniref:TfoX/Sxy family DNA transformation protein n=1 Tax=Vibrio mediterranei TaxID=689 RepID=UPI0040687A23